MDNLLNHILRAFDITALFYISYLIVYICSGFFMNWFGITTKIAKFKNWWQVITCYVFYLIPCSIAVRELSYWDQYLYGLLFLGVLEFLGYSLKTSIVFEGNILDRLFTERNFALGMTLFFASYIPAGNAISAFLFSIIS